MPEQEKISDVVNVADLEIQQWKAKLAALKRQKKGFMQQLLTGQVRVNFQ
jgi:restriction endonuclease S subunit